MWQPRIHLASNQNQFLIISVESLIYWRDVKKSGVVFGIGMAILLAMSMFSLISVFAYISLLTLLGTVSFRVYKTVMSAVQKTSDGHPFKWVCNFCVIKLLTSSFLPFLETFWTLTWLYRPSEHKTSLESLLHTLMHTSLSSDDCSWSKISLIHSSSVFCSIWWHT